MLGAADPLELLADPKVARLLSVSLRTLARWDADPNSDFPPPVIHNGRKYRQRQALEAWLRKRALDSLQANAKPGRPRAKSSPSPAKKPASPAAASVSPRKRRTAHDVPRRVEDH